MPTKKQVGLFIGLYALLRLFSFFFGPETPLHPEHWLNTLVTSVIFISAIILLLKNDNRGWYIIALEIMLGGAGNFLNIHSIALRTLLLPASLLIFFGQKIWRHQLMDYLKQERREAILIKLLLGIAVVGSIIGLYNNHARVLVMSDIIPYAYLLYYFPLKALLQDKQFIGLAKNATIAALIGNAAFILFALVGFSTSLFVLQDTFYHWFRDVASGKVTELPFNYFRIVLNEHLLLVPVTIFFVSKLLAKEQTKLYGLLTALSLLILSTNLTRIYFIALAVGLFALIRQSTLKRWFITCSVVVVSFMAIFVTLHTTLSRGQSLGLELFGLRLQSIVSPTMENSSLSRLLLLPKIKEKIALHPVIGNGLGDTITVYSPVFKKTVTTPHYDWGYLEILGELGIIGFVIWIIFITQLFLKFKKEQLQIWHLGSLLALLAITITSPALFHGLGIIWITYLLANEQR